LAPDWAGAIKNMRRFRHKRKATPFLETERVGERIQAQTAEVEIETTMAHYIESNRTYQKQIIKTTPNPSLKKGGEFNWYSLLKFFR